MQVKQSGQRRPQFLTVHHQVELPVLKVEFSRLEIIGKLLADRLLNYNSSGKSEHRSGLGNINIAKARKAGGYAAGRRVGNNGNI
ncbi:hypothetical protein D3C81_2139430 [compost metagenome]